MSVGYTVAQVAKILDQSPEQVRGFVRQGLVEALRGPRNEYRFTFQDLLLLRTACGLREKKVPLRKVRGALQALREQLPEGRPVSAVQVLAEGHEVIVQDAQARWVPTSGQMLFDFDVAALQEKVRALVPPAPTEAPPDADRDLDAAGWLKVARELEVENPERARDALRRALERAPEHPEARLALAQLLHDEGCSEQGLAHAALVLKLDAKCGQAHLLVGTIQEDLHVLPEAEAAYRRALKLLPRDKQVQLSLGRLLQRLGRTEQANELLNAFRDLDG